MENNNSVCFVATVKEIKPIEGADKIELAVVGGWNCIVQKGQYKVDDWVVTATTDAVIPIKLSDELNVTNYLRKGGRVRTVKLRGVYSECLVIPLKNIPFMENYYEGKDMMYAMDIWKYEPPVKQVQLASGKKIRYSENPNFHIYYKFPNAKNVPGMFTEEDWVEISRKIHGTNARYGIVKKNKLSLFDKVKKLFGVKWVDYEFVAGSHNVEKGSDSQGFYDTNVWYDVADKYNIKEVLWKFAKDTERFPDGIGIGVVLYGEIYGAGIQKNYDYGLTEIEFAGFDLEINGKYCSTDESFNFVGIEMDLPYVDVLYVGEWNKEIEDMYVFKNFIPGTKVPHEGVVVKHHTGDRHKVAKVINPDYLIYAENWEVGDSH
jgi:RNA ligase (TIGR02306 family)